jgi:GNAT superfamily N-acetyltransferase
MSAGWFQPVPDLAQSEGGSVIVEILDEPLSKLSEHGAIPIAFHVESVLELLLVERGLGGIALREQIVDHPYVKDYDAIEGEGPVRWLRQFDVSNWGLLAAYVDGKRIGGAVVAHDTANVDLLERRSDLAALWDLRVEPAMRRFGVGRALFSAAEVWARERQCAYFQIETQNTNVPACRFYLNMNCGLRSIDRFAYPHLPTESRLLWIKEL